MIAIIDYKAGNAPSVLHAVTRLGYEAVLARNGRDCTGAAHIILPGVGSAKATMESLREGGFIDTLTEAVLQRKAFFLGICVGLQILFEHSEEDDTVCLGWLKGSVVKFDTRQVRVPQMGWNKVVFTEHTGLYRSDKYLSASDGHFYFVNSYHAKPEQTADIWGTAEYVHPFVAAVRRDNIYATQFHVEKSGETGLTLLRGFLEIC
jgi:glutamine amidotransferase